MNKGLTNYYRVRRAVLNRQVVLVLSLLFLLLSHLIVYAWGRADGWDRGEYFTEKNIEAALVEAIADGRNFNLHNIDVTFYPREDGGAMVKRQ